MMNCKEATRLMSQDQDRPLSLKERVALQWHTLMCIGCTNYGKQMAFLRRVARRYREGLRDEE